jgi:hypothetical protein
VRSPEDQIEEISPTSPSVEPPSGFTPSSHPSTSEAPAKPMDYRGNPEEQIETTSPTSPSVRSSPRLTPSLYPSTSEASANLLYYHGQYHTPYPVAQSINFGARQDCSSHHYTHYADYLPSDSITKAPSTGLYTNKQHQVPSSEHTIRWLQSTQPIQLAHHSCRCCHCTPMAQHSGFGPVNSTAPSPGSSQQTLPSNLESSTHTASYGLPQQSWPNENNNANNNWDFFSRYWNHQRFPHNYTGFI